MTAPHPLAARAPVAAPAPKRAASLPFLAFIVALAFILNACVSEPEGNIYLPTPPEAVRTSPAHLESGVALDKVITAGFNVPMNPGTINTQTFVVLRGAGLGADTVRGTVTYSAADTTATFTPDDSLLKCQTYTVILSAGAMDSLCNVPADTTWTFTTPHPVPVPPVVTATSPEHLKGNVALDAVLTAAFNEPMDPGSITPQTFTLVRASETGPIPVPGTVSYAPGANTATFTPHDSLLKCKVYSASISATTPDSLCFTLATDSTWSFNTGMLPVQPVVTRAAPANLEGNVALDAVITATFNIPMDTNTINAQTFVVLRAGGGGGGGNDTVHGTVAYSAEDTTLTFTPDDSLLKCQTYTVILTLGAGDSLCNIFVDTTWTFTTPNPVPVQPVVTATFPTNLQGNVAPNAVITTTFSEPMDPNSINAQTFTVVMASGVGPVPVPGMVSYSPITRTATFTPNDSLLKCKVYTVSISAMTPDSLCLTLAVDSTWSFNTVTLPVQPVITQTSPAILDGAVALDAVITATFNVPMNPNSINASTFTVTRGTGSFAVAIPGTVSYSAGTNTATFTPDDSLLKCQPYTMTIHASSLDSICSRLDVDTTWSFTIPNKPSLMPAVQTSPVDLDGSVPLNSVVTAIFNVPMSPFSVNAQTFLVVRDGDSGPDTILGSASYSPFTRTATFTPNSPLLPNAHYNVYLTATMDSLCVQLVFDTTWSFTTSSSNSPPKPVLEAINDGATFSITAHANPVLELFWIASTGATTYHLQVSTIPSFVTTVYDAPAVPHTNGIVTDAVPMTNLPAGTYYWRVNATGSGGTSPWSITWSFTTTP